MDKPTRGSKNILESTKWTDPLEDETSPEDERSTKRTDPHIYIYIYIYIYMKISDGYIPHTNSHDEILINP